MSKKISLKNHMFNELVKFHEDMEGLKVDIADELEIIRNYGYEPSQLTDILCLQAFLKVNEPLDFDPEAFQDAIDLL